MTNAGYVKFDWNKYIDLAEELLKSIPDDLEDEAKERCGISRAYYGAFHRAARFLRDVAHQTINVYQKGSHNEVIKSFEYFGSNNRKYLFVAEELKRLKRKRERADYDDRYFATILPSVKLKNELISAIIHAKKIVECINEIEGNER